MNTTWLNLIHNFICNDCNYKWIAPKVGSCPKCYSINTKLAEDNVQHYGPVRV